MNTEFNYLYRDASNYKKWGSMVFKGIPTTTLEDFQEAFEKFLEDGEYFIPTQINVDTVYLWDGDYDLDEMDDHSYHEFAGFELTERPATDSRTIQEFFDEVKKIGQKGWNSFDPKSWFNGG